ncbi:hypothetical protein [Castellaniella sp.]|uniref:hypothetical protein n=1 Tax=Castellaniella sp. TaxID=1955812 RepID=UPI003C77FC03
MAYFQPSQERPRHVKRFLTVRDIEDAATSGCREIVHADDLVITDAAREAAHDLGVAIVKPDAARQAARPAAAPVASQPPAQAPSPQAAPMPYAAAPRMPSAPAAFAPSPGAHADEHPLVQDLARAIRARWQPVRRRRRQLLD